MLAWTADFLHRMYQRSAWDKGGHTMGVRVTDLRCKEVINVCDGLRLGFVTDVEVKLPEGQIVALVVPGPCRFFGLFGRKDDFVIPWACIRRIGDDIILVEIEPDKCRVPRPKRSWP